MNKFPSLEIKAVYNGYVVLPINSEAGQNGVFKYSEMRVFESLESLCSWIKTHIALIKA